MQGRNCQSNFRSTERFSFSSSSGDLSWRIGNSSKRGSRWGESLRSSTCVCDSGSFEVIFRGMGVLSLLGNCEGCLESHCSGTEEHARFIYAIPLITSGDATLLNPRFHSNKLHFPRLYKLWGSGQTITRFGMSPTWHVSFIGKRPDTWRHERSNGVKDLRQILSL